MLNLATIRNQSQVWHFAIQNCLFSANECVANDVRDNLIHSAKRGNAHISSCASADSMALRGNHRATPRVRLSHKTPPNYDLPEKCLPLIQTFKARADQRGLRPNMIVGSGNGGMPEKSSSRPKKTEDEIVRVDLGRRSRSSDEREIESFLHTPSMSSRTSSDPKSKDIIHLL